MANDIRFGDWVICDAYVIKSGKSICVDPTEYDPELPQIIDTIAETVTDTDAEDYLTVERYHTKESRFGGIFVGTTTKKTRIVAEYFDNTYASGWCVTTDTPQTFAVVYYGKNKKRYVPLDKIRKQEV